MPTKLRSRQRPIHRTDFVGPAGDAGTGRPTSSGAAWGSNRSVSLPGIDVSIGDMVDGLGRVAGTAPVARISWQPDAHIQKIVAGWPYRFDPARARKLGFSADAGIDEIIRAHIDDQLGGTYAA